VRLGVWRSRIRARTSPAIRSGAGRSSARRSRRRSLTSSTAPRARGSRSRGSRTRSAAREPGSARRDRRTTGTPRRSRRHAERLAALVCFQRGSSSAVLDGARNRADAPCAARRTDQHRNRAGGAPTPEAIENPTRTPMNVHSPEHVASGPQEQSDPNASAYASRPTDDWSPRNAARAAPTGAQTFDDRRVEHDHHCASITQDPPPPLDWTAWLLITCFMGFPSKSRYVSTSERGSPNRSHHSGFV